MTFISYAQNFEDIMLNRALKNIDNGFYIDVGACHPTTESVTKAFYDRGWNGINIEPSQHFFPLLQRDRPRDINLNVAAGMTDCELMFHEILETGLSSFKEEIANQQTEKGYKVNSRMVPVRTLASICTEYHIKTIHFLKIDAEGSEREVLQGFPFTSVIPWIVIVEALDPITGCDVSINWENLLFEKGYLQAYYDGLNKFYVSKDHLELMECFEVPPNCLDDYVTYRELARTDQALALVYSSWSWRLTSPLRKISNIMINSRKEK